MNHLRASQHVWQVKKTLRDTGCGTLMNRGIYQTTWCRGSRGRQSWRQSIDTTEIVNAGFICEVVFMAFALSNSFVLVKIYGNYSMLREADYEPFMTHRTYQTTWRWGSRGCRSWMQSIDTTNIVNLGFICAVVITTFVL